ncbi:hypothetical protein AVEN_14893-1 [Araneus ventricosus]|uniref:DUF5641 domain-containing protein n=1 Tax=Araneus ventricosus TaxID=182803 RepID=A0A4Y2F7I8_ARAVE|nr:hypothetical protein AVEN_14893-1 [Araneus ventricosus]
MSVQREKAVILPQRFEATRVTPVVTRVLAAVRTLDRFGISDRTGAAIVSAALQDVGIISESNVLNVIDRNKIRRGRTMARTTLLSRVIKDYDHDQFGLYLDGRKDRTINGRQQKKSHNRRTHKGRSTLAYISSPRESKTASRAFEPVLLALKAKMGAFEQNKKTSMQVHGRE